MAVSLFPRPLEAAAAARAISSKIRSLSPNVVSCNGLLKRQVAKSALLRGALPVARRQGPDPVASPVVQAAFFLAHPGQFAALVRPIPTD